MQHILERTTAGWALPGARVCKRPREGFWVARLSAGTGEPGAVDKTFTREFLPSAPRTEIEHAVVVDMLLPGDYIEIGGHNSTNKRTGHIRQYGRVHCVDDASLVYDELAAVDAHDALRADDIENDVSATDA